MPYLNCTTSVALTEEKRNGLLPLLSKALCGPTGKPEQYCMVSVGSASISLAGKAGPAAFVDVRAIGGLDPAANKKLSASICAVLKKEVGIPSDRVYLTFADVAAENWGFDGGTFG